MPIDPELREILVELIQCLKGDHRYAASVGSELVVLRDALLELSEGRLQSLLESCRNTSQAPARAEVARNLRQYDGLLRRLKNL